MSGQKTVGTDRHPIADWTLGYIRTAGLFETRCLVRHEQLFDVFLEKVNYFVTGLQLCLEYKEKVCEDAFEVPGSSNNPDTQAAMKGRLNRKQQVILK